MNDYYIDDIIRIVENFKGELNWFIWHAFYEIDDIDLQVSLDMQSHVIDMTENTDKLIKYIDKYSGNISMKTITAIYHKIIYPVLDLGLCAVDKETVKHAQNALNKLLEILNSIKKMDGVENE